MKITSEVLELSAQFTNALKEREIDLRDNKIPSIDNLAITRDQFDTIDLTNNELRILNNFPTLLKLQTLLCSNNQLHRIDSDMVGRLPNLKMLILTNNRFEDLDSITNVKLFPKLQILSFVDNMVSKRPDYRLYVIARCPKLNVLDFKPVTRLEREQAATIFAEPSVSKRKLAQRDDASKESKRTQLSEPLSREHKEALKQLVIGAQTTAEIERLEAIINEGIFTAEVAELLNSRAQHNE